MDVHIERKWDCVYMEGRQDNHVTDVEHHDLYDAMDACVRRICSSHCGGSCCMRLIVKKCSDMRTLKPWLECLQLQSPGQAYCMQQSQPTVLVSLRRVELNIRNE